MRPPVRAAASTTLAAALVLVLTGCGGGNPPSPVQPTPAPTPAPAPPPPPVASTDLWTVAGRVVSMGSGAALGGVRVTSEVGPSTTTDGGGGFLLSANRAPEFTPHAFTVDSPVHMPRRAYVNYQRGLREGVVFDLIPLAAPFSIDFYRALVRNAHEAPGQLEPLRRWTRDPRFYVRIADQNGRAIEPEVVDVVLGSIPEAVRQFTGGRLAVAQIETGTATRPPESGWIVVNITRDPSSRFCGQAMVGADPGEITLVNDRCNCGSVKISGGLVAHEVGHALGFWHVPDRRHVMFDTIAAGCPAVSLSTEERHHAAIAYQRPPGNRDPDADPQAAAAAQIRGADQPGMRVTCGRR